MNGLNNQEDQNGFAGSYLRSGWLRPSQSVTAMVPQPTLVALEPPCTVMALPNTLRTPLSLTWNKVIHYRYQSHTYVIVTIWFAVFLIALIIVLKCVCQFFVVDRVCALTPEGNTPGDCRLFWRIFDSWLIHENWNNLFMFWVTDVYIWRKVSFGV